MESKNTYESWITPVVVGLLALSLNVATYFIIPKNIGDILGQYGYIGIFLITAIANATILIPVPYFSVILRLSHSLNFGGIAVAGAAGSTLGELVAFYAGRSGKAAIQHSRFSQWLTKQLRHRWRSFWILFLLSAPPNPAFDVAGILAGIMGLPLWMFLTAVFLGRIVRISIMTSIGIYMHDD